MLSVSLTQWSQSIQQVTYILTVAVCVYLVFENNLSMGSIIAASILVSRSMAPMVRLSAALVRWHNVRAALGNLDRIAYSPQDVSAQEPKLRRSSVRGDVHIDRIQYAYGEKASPDLAVPNLSIGRGERVALLGNNGSGKSTLLKILAGLYVPDAGSIMLDGLDLRQIDSRDVRAHIAYLPQEVALFRGTLRDNLVFADPSVGDEALLESLDRAGLSAFLRNHPEGLDLPISDGGAGLSVGQKQTVGLARLFLTDPAIVLMDEPTASLDPELEAHVIRSLDKWLADRTLVVATHRMPILNLTARIGVLHRGRLLAEGPRAEILARIGGAARTGRTERGTAA